MSDSGKLRRRALLQGSAAASAAAVVGVVGVAGVAGSGEAAAQPAQVTQAPATVQNVRDGRYTATNTTFGTTIAGGDYTHCAVVFTAPESGRVLIHWSGGVRNLSTNNAPVAYLSPQVRTGSTVGSGTIVLNASDARTVRVNAAGAQTVRAGATHLLAGLTPGATYNARILHRVTSNTGEFFYRGLIVAPAT